jgi:serine/threonine protein phosphatase PrpC
VNGDAFGGSATEEGGLLWVVADGIGSLPMSPAVAQGLVDALQEQLRTGFGYAPDRLEQACRRADRQLRQAYGEAGGAAAALVYCVESAVWTVHCGDVRVYWFRGDQALARTEDDVDPQRSHVLRSYFGGRAASAADLSLRATGPWRPQPGDRIVIVTDGVHALVSDPELGGLVRAHAERSEVEALLDLVRARGGDDDATLVALTWTAAHQGDDQAATPVAAPWVGRTPLHSLERDLTLQEGTTEEGPRTQEILPEPPPPPAKEAPWRSPGRFAPLALTLVLAALLAWWLIGGR